MNEKKAQGRPTNMEIDGEALRILVEKYPLNMSEISTLILQADRSYLRCCLKSGSMNPRRYTKLCEALKINPADFMKKVEEEKQEAKPQDVEPSELIRTLAQMYNNQKETISEIKALKAQNQELITVLKGMAEMMKQINSNINTNTEKVKAIFTEVKYNK